MEDLPLPGGCKNMEEFSAYIHRRIEECMKDYRSKEETMKHLMDHFQIPHDMTSIVWDLLEATYPENFKSHYESCETYQKIREASRIDSYKLIPSVEEFSYYVHGRIMECMRDYKSKEETVKHLLDQYRITPESTNTVWDRLEQGYQDNFRSYYEACEKNRKLREQEEPTGEEVTANAQITAETSSSSTSVASRIFILRGLKDIKVKRQEKQRTCPPGQSLMGIGPSPQMLRLRPNAQANGQKAMNLEHLLLLLNSSRHGA
ncbi:hypothetical protein Bca4012_013611 [Brassica carinata]